MTEYYKEFEQQCQQEALTEILTTKSKDTYMTLLALLQRKNIAARGYGDDWNCVFEIRFNLHKTNVHQKINRIPLTNNGTKLTIENLQQANSLITAATNRIQEINDGTYIPHQQPIPFITENCQELYQITKTINQSVEKLNQTAKQDKKET